MDIKKREAKAKDIKGKVSSGRSVKVSDIKAKELGIRRGAVLRPVRRPINGAYVGTASGRYRRAIKVKNISTAFSKTNSGTLQRIKSGTFNRTRKYGSEVRDTAEHRGDSGTNESAYATDRISAGMTEVSSKGLDFSRNSVRRVRREVNGSNGTGMKVRGRESSSISPRVRVRSSERPSPKSIDRSSSRVRATSTVKEIKRKEAFLKDNGGNGREMTKNPSFIKESYGVQNGNFVNNSRVNGQITQETKNAYLRKNDSVEKRAFAQGKRRVVKKQQEKAAKRVVHKPKGARESAKRLAASIKRATESTKALISTLIAGGSIALSIVIICVMFGAAFSFFGDSSSSNYEGVSAEVEAYTPLITKYAKVHGIPQYVELIKAVMMQESGGRGLDPMQCAESGYNTRYPNEPNGITDPEYSIDIGVKTLAASIKAAGVESPVDMDRIRLALQGYNYGNGYISWAIRRDGGYTVENASIFSDEQAEKHGWSGYGDKQYVTHVLRYYPYGNYAYGVGNALIINVAAQQIGNEGGQKFWSWYGFNGRVEWCCIFVSWCADQCGYLDSGTIPRFSVVGTGIDWFKERNLWHDRGSYTPMPGDIIFFDWDADGTRDHVGFVESCDGVYVYTIEGNSGDICARRQYPMGSAEIIGYGVPRY